MTPKLKPNVLRPGSPGSFIDRIPAPPGQPVEAAAKGYARAGEPSQNGSGGSKTVSKRLHRKKAAEYLGVSLSWLDKSRLRGDGPAFLQIGCRVVYDLADLDAYLASCRRQTTSESRQGG